MNGWRDAGIKLAQMLADRFYEARLDFPTEEITVAANQSIALSGLNFMVSTEDGPVEIDVNLIKAVVDKINDSHKKIILEIIGSVGEFIGDVPPKESAKKDEEDRYAGEDEDHVFLRLDGMLMKISKDMATKILALGVVP